jgi:hypothetical protein
MNVDIAILAAAILVCFVFSRGFRKFFGALLGLIVLAGGGLAVYSFWDLRVGATHPAQLAVWGAFLLVIVVGGYWIDHRLPRRRSDAETGYITYAERWRRSQLPNK